MIRKMICLGILFLVALSLQADNPAGAPVDKKVGYALLDAVGNQFHEMAMLGSASAEKIDQVLQKLMADAKIAKESNQIDQAFFAHYRRVLAVMKLASIPDPQGILGNIAQQEIVHFIQDVLGEDGESVASLGQMARAISEEILNLRLDLDQFETKEKIRKALSQRFSDPKSKK